MTTARLPEPAVQPSRPSFAHASEAELARILDFYDVRWSYEPDTFPIGWSLDGEVVESFAPDFYLPDLDLYVELTTLKQKLVRKKNRKLRRLRELYPDVRIKLFYARDFRMLLLKFGRLALADELSGTIGQATPPRLHALPAVPDPSGEPGRAAPGAPDLDDGLGTGGRAETVGASAAPAEPDAALPVAAPLVGGRGRRRGRRRGTATRTHAAADGGPGVA
jgi:hypothetical protein